VAKDRRALGALVCGLIALVLPVSIPIILFGFTRQQLATTPDWVYGSILIPALAAAVAAIVLGHLSMRGASRGFAVAGLMMGYGVLLIPAMFFAAALAGRMANRPVYSNEMLATGLVPILQTSLEEYRRDRGQYPDSLAELVERTAISPDLLRTGHNNGYFYRYARTASGYRLQADPEVKGTTGRRSFDVSSPP
jgi:hypothetical protein